MERLTWRDAIGQALLASKYNDKYDALELIDILLDRLAAYEDTGLEPEEIKLLIDGLDDYRKAEAEGRLIVLPCKVGDTVYVIKKVVAHGYPDPVFKKEIFEEMFSYEHLYYPESIFLTREEAEGRLGRSVIRDGVSD